jgi:UDP-glucuronate 4-epimerase
MATYLVTGAAGFIGARVAELLLQDGHSVVSIDNLNDYYDVRLKDYRLSRLLGDESWKPGNSPRASRYSQSGLVQRGNFTFEEVDIEDNAALERLFTTYTFDAVFNLAARAGVRASISDPERYLLTNCLGALHLLQQMVKSGVPRFVTASTSSLYAGAKMPFFEDSDVTRPLSPYAASKLSAEALAHAWHHLYDLNVCVLRYFTVYGPAGRPDMSPFRFAESIRRGLPIQLFGDGSQTRDFTYIDDIARGTIAALNVKGFEVINLGGGATPISILEMIKVIEGTMGISATIHYQSAHAGDMKNTAANIKKASSLLGWRPSKTAQYGLEELASWHLENANWLGKINL